MNLKQGIEKSASALHQADLEPTEFESRTIRLEELTGIAIGSLRSLGIPAQLPGQTGQSSGRDPALLCLRPGEWLAVSESLAPRELLAEMSTRVGGECTAVHDCSHGLAVFRLQGKGAPWLLGKLSGLDFLAGIESGAHCARTRMGHISVLVRFHGSEAGIFTFDLLLDRSYARYFWELLTASAAHADDLATAYGNNA